MSSYSTNSYFILGLDKILAFVDHLESESEEEDNNKVNDYIYYSNYKFVGPFDELKGSHIYNFWIKLTFQI